MTMIGHLYLKFNFIEQYVLPCLIMHFRKPEFKHDFHVLTFARSRGMCHYLSSQITVFNMANIKYSITEVLRPPGGSLLP